MEKGILFFVCAFCAISCAHNSVGQKSIHDHAAPRVSDNATSAIQVEHETHLAGHPSMHPSMPVAQKDQQNLSKVTGSTGVQETAVFEVNVVKNALQFSMKLITVKAGQHVEIHIENPDEMQHNLVISQPGTMSKVGMAADALVSHPDGVAMAYVPRIPEVLFATGLLDPEDTAILEFDAPAFAGDYPFMCTFPGHWRIMNGVMKVVAP